MIKALSEEIQEFEQDKKAVVETRVRLVQEAKAELGTLKGQFIAKSAKLVKESIGSHLDTEITQLKEDIQAARENMFGRRLFEAFASEFAVTHLNENREIKKLQSVVAEKDKQLKEAVQSAEAKAVLVETKEKEIKIIKESQDRKAKLSEMLSTLTKEKAIVMGELLESVQTDKLQSAFDKYLPAVLNNAPSKSQPRAVIAESKTAVTGDKSAKTPEADTNVIDIKRLAGLK